MSEIRTGAQALKIQHDLDHKAAIEKKRLEVQIEADKWEYKGVSGSRAFWAGWELAMRQQLFATIEPGASLYGIESKSLESPLK